MNHIGNFKIRDCRVVPVLDTNATTAGDVLCATTQLTVLPPGWKGTVERITVLDKDHNGAALDVVLLEDDTSLGTAGSAVSASDAAAEKVVAVQQVAASDYADLVNSQLADVELAKPIGAGGGALYAALIDRTGGNTFTASGIVLTVYLRSDDPN
ncbi:MAG: hypothetical protein AAGJ81_10710 [Verrucomicrobiota bacterium]